MGNIDREYVRGVGVVLGRGYGGEFRGVDFSEGEVDIKYI